VVFDLGCGDGRAVVAAAAAEPASLVIGVDAVAASMAESSRRAARSPRKGGVPNALFVVSAVEAIPSALHGLAGRVSLLFPWGSLLRGALGVDEAAAGAIAALVRPGGRLEIVASVTPRDGVEGVARLDETVVAAVAGRQACRGLRLVTASRLGAAQVAALPSTWARRLAKAPDGERPVWRLEFEGVPAVRATIDANGGSPVATDQRGPLPIPALLHSRHARS
jgi:16S rRNA (adenine(1408)-N(1))-methyltransferase